MKTASQVTVIHTIPGRLRLRLTKRCQAIWAILEEKLAAQQGVRWARLNSKCASLVIRYNPQLLSREDLLRHVTELTVARNGPMAVSAKTSHPPAPCPARRHSALRRFVGLSLLAIGVFFRQTVLRLPVAQGFFSPLGVITAFAALPLAREGLSDLGKRRISLKSFLGGSIIAAVAAGEALAALEILWITGGGELLQDWITERSRRAIRNILEVTEKETYVLRDGVEVSMSVDRVQPGDTVVLHTGEKISVDGKIVKGEAIIDDAAITGRAEPAIKKKGSKVFAGTFIRQGVIFIKAEQVGDRTYLARILRMVEDSLENKAPIESVADRLAKSLIKTGFIVTFGTLILTRSLWRAFTVMLVMACPCATILAASTAVSAAINAAARRHILIKGGRYLEDISNAEIVCFDKTGTLTTSEPELKQFVSISGKSEDSLLQLAYSTEIHNSHPVALAIKKLAQERGLVPVSHDVCEYILGKGVRSDIHGDEILVGSHKLMEQFGIEPDILHQHLDTYKKQGLTLVFIARNKELLGLFGFANQDRENVAEIIRFLRNDGIHKTAMITGDAKYSALEMAGRLNFDDCRYSVLPEEKAVIVDELRKSGGKVLMVGDGINDALALAEADIGVAMGAGGSEVAIEAADIALVQDDLKGVVYVRCLSRQTLKVVHQNFWIATSSNIAGVALGALGLLSPVMAGLVHITHTLGILANSSRLLFFEPPALRHQEAKPAAQKPLHMKDVKMNAKALIDLQQYFQVVHHVPGRIRVKFDMALATNPQAKEFLNGNGGQSLPGITNYRLNFMAQSIVIEYDRGRIAPNLVQELFTTKDPQRLGAIVNLWVSST